MRRDCLTPDEIAGIQDAYLAGAETVPQIAARYRRSQATVYNYCYPLVNRHNPLTPRQIAGIRAAYLDGKPVDEIARRYRRSVSIIHKRCAHLSNRRGPIIDMDMAVALVAEGVSQGRVAKLYGVSGAAVCQALKRRGRTHSLVTSN